MSKKSVFGEAPSDEGKRSDVTGVNDSPVDCQSRDRNRHSDLSAELTEGLTTPPSRRSAAHLPLHRGGFGAVHQLDKFKFV